jgi:hypothetical protein
MLLNTINKTKFKGIDVESGHCTNDRCGVGAVDTLSVLLKV